MTQFDLGMKLLDLMATEKVTSEQLSSVDHHNRLYAVNSLGYYRAIIDVAKLLQSDVNVLHFMESQYHIEITETLKDN